MTTLLDHSTMQNISETVEGIPICLETNSSKIQKIEKLEKLTNLPDKDFEIPKEENVKQQDNDNKSTVVPRTIFNDKFKTVISQITEILNKSK